MQTVIDQVLALMLTPAEQPTESARSALRRTVMSVDVAWVLAILDPELARDLLSRLVPPGANDFNGTRLIGKWLQAWAMVDAEHSAAVFD